MSTTATRLTAKEYYALTTEGDRRQLVEGELVVNEPKPIHALLQARLTVALGSWTSATKDRGVVLAPTDVRIDEHNVYSPDLLWFSAEHIPTDLDAYPVRTPTCAWRSARPAPGATTSARRSASTRPLAYPSCGSSTTPPPPSSSTAARRPNRRSSTPSRARRRRCAHLAAAPGLRARDRRAVRALSGGR